MLKETAFSAAVYKYVMNETINLHVASPKKL